MKRLSGRISEANIHKIEIQRTYRECKIHAE